MGVVRAPSARFNLGWIRRASLRTRLVLLTLAVIVPAMLGAMAYISHAATTILRLNAASELSTVTKNVANSVEKWDDYKVLAVQNLMGQPGIISMDPRQQQPLLNHMQHVYNRLDALFTVAINGQTVCRSDGRPFLNFSDRFWFQAAMAGQPVARQTVVSRTMAKPVLIVAAPIRDGQNQIVGVMAASTDLRTLTEQVGAVKLGRTGHVFVVNERGQVLAHPNLSLAMEFNDLSKYPPVASALGGNPGPMAFTDGGKQRWLAHTTRLGNGWAVIGMQQEDEVMAQATRFTHKALAVATCAVVLILGLIWLVASRLLKPIGELTDAAEGLAQGQWEYRVPDTRQDEMGALARAFNRMAQQLQLGYLRIEDEVVRRTDELNRSNADLLAARLAAERANRAKDEFLANMSHEIRTPMTAVLGYTDLILDPNQTPAERQEMTASLRRNAHHLLDLINNILDISKIEAGHMAMEINTCQLPQLLAEVISLTRPRLTEKGLDFGLVVDGLIPATVQTDSLRLRQVLVNLLVNAAKFTQAGSVTLRISSQSSLGENIVRLDVIDTGVGINQEQIGRLFRPFSQADESTTRRFGGTGLGLCISQHMARLLGGQITVTSQPGEGSTFSVQINGGSREGVVMIDHLHEAIRPNPESSQVLPDIALSGRILLAEDGVDNQRLISLQLRKAGADVTIVEHGQAAIDALTTADFDLILMDMQMPVLDGYAAVRQLRRANCRTPIIALTAHAMADDRAKCIAAGCDDYLTKPIERHLLLKSIQQYLKQADGQPAMTIQAMDNPSINAQIKIKENTMQSLRSDYANDPDMAEIIGPFVAGLPQKVRAMTDMALRGQTEELRSAAHQLKGAGGGYGFGALTTAAARVEDAIKSASSPQAITKELQDLIALIRTIADYNAAAEADPTSQAA